MGIYVENIERFSMGQAIYKLALGDYGSFDELLVEKDNNTILSVGLIAFSFGFFSY